MSPNIVSNNGVGVNSRLWYSWSVPGAVCKQRCRHGHSFVMVSFHKGHQHCRDNGILGVCGWIFFMQNTYQKSKTLMHADLKDTIMYSVE